MDRQLQWITQAQLERPEVAAQLQQLGELYSKKLWHQLTVKLEQYVDEEVFQRDGFLIALYQNFISGFAHKINLLKLAFFAVTVAKCLSTPQVTKHVPCFFTNDGLSAATLHSCRRVLHS